MIDWLVIVTTAVTFMTAFVTKIGEGFAQKAGEEIFDVVKSKLKSDKEGERLLSEFKKKPARYQSALVDIIKEKAESDKSFGDKLRNLVENNSVNTQKISQVAQGDGNIQAAGNNITINSKTSK